MDWIFMLLCVLFVVRCIILIDYNNGRVMFVRFKGKAWVILTVIPKNH